MRSRSLCSFWFACVPFVFCPCTVVCRLGSACSCNNSVNFGFVFSNTFSLSDSFFFCTLIASIKLYSSNINLNTFIASSFCSEVDAGSGAADCAVRIPCAHAGVLAFIDTILKTTVAMDAVQKSSVIVTESLAIP